MHPHPVNNLPTPKPVLSSSATNEGPDRSFHRVVLAALFVVTSLTAVGCIEHRVKTDPIHITVDVNLRVDEELKEFFAYEEEIERRVIKEKPAPEPSE